MSKFAIIPAIFWLALITSACGAPMNKLDIKQNPEPRMRYEISATVDQAPVAVEAVDGVVKYGVANDHCVPLQPGSGARLSPDERVQLAFSPADAKGYHSAFYVDRFKDEDYYGRGVCHWAVVAATVTLQINGRKFSAAIFHDDIVASRPVTTYFASSDVEVAKNLTGAANAQKIIFGNTNRSLFSPDTRLFSVTLTTREAFP